MEKYKLELYDNEEETYSYKREEAYIRAKKRVDSLLGFYWHLASYIIVNLFLIVVIGVYSNEGFTSFGTYATAFFWGIGLLFHFLGVFGPNFMFGKNWEKRKIRDFMEKENENWD